MSQLGGNGSAVQEPSWSRPVMATCHATYWPADISSAYLHGTRTNGRTVHLLGKPPPNPGRTGNKKSPIVATPPTCCSAFYKAHQRGVPTHCATQREKGPGRRSTRSDGLKRLKNCRSTHRLARALGQRRISRWLAHSCNCPNRVAWPSSGGGGWWCQSPSSPSPG